MAMTEKQIKRRMDEAWELHYKSYDLEAQWYGNDEPNIWVCDIPSKKITVKMELNEKAKTVTIWETTLEEQSRYDYVRDAEWIKRSCYCWKK